ncbi:MAG: polysaccharide biosynthesis protein [Desulfomonile tiedjei]|nr:polysaccharide biosynthesis protein [Desulfomonile tiedjei]
MPGTEWKPADEGWLPKLEQVVKAAAPYIRLNHVLLIAVFVLAGVSFWISYELRFDFRVPRVFADQRLLFLPYVAFLKLSIFYILRGHSANWKYFGLRDIPRLLFHGAASSLAVFLMSALSDDLWIPRGVIVIDCLTSTMLIGGAHVTMRLFRETLRDLFRNGKSPGRKDAVVLGAGDAGEMIVREILRNHNYGVRVRAFFDDDRRKQGLSIHGIRVEGGIDDVPFYVQHNPVQMAIIAIPSATNAQMRSFYSILKDLNLSVKTLPSLHEMMEGFSQLPQLREINITDLLGREEVRIDTEQVRNLIRDRVVLVTGAGGSIGSELCRQVLKRGPKQLLLMERSENNLFHVHRQLSALSVNVPVVPLLCDVTDAARVDHEFLKFRPDLVFHAAAHKHVPLQEINAAECFRNNIHGIQTLARAADRFGVDRFLLISTDKAVNPTSVMGATKRACEIYCQAFAQVSATKFLSVRFGNVLASEGSVIPIFLEQIEKGGPVTVTHPEMRRYFMTIPEAVTLVLQATALGESGQIMMLDMGKPMKIVDLVQQLIQLAGRQPAEIPIDFIGPRPGEKLFEELSCDSEVCVQTAHEKIKVFNQDGKVPKDPLGTINAAVDSLRPDTSNQEVRQKLKAVVPEYEISSEALSPEETSGVIPRHLLGTMGTSTLALSNKRNA